MEEAHQPAHTFLRTYLIKESADVFLEDDDKGDDSHTHQFIQDETQQTHFQHLTYEKPDQHKEHDAHEDVERAGFLHQAIDIEEQRGYQEYV